MNEGRYDGPANWYLVEGVITQSSNIYGGSGNADAKDPAKPGSYLLNGEKDWADYTMSVDLRSRDDDAIGIVFRYKDAQNYYRFSMDRQRNYRRLIKKVGGRVTVLSEDAFSYRMNKWYTVKVAVVGHKIEIYMDDKPIFRVVDNAIERGQIGFYCWGNAGSDFRNLLMMLNSGWVVIDEGDISGPSLWSVKDGIISQTSEIHGGSLNKEDPDKPGTYVINGDPDWVDYELKLKLRSTDDDAIGVMFRYKDSNNYYRFSMDKERSYRRLIKKEDGQVHILAEDLVPYEIGKWYKLKIKVVRDTIRIYLDGKRLFDVIDSSIDSGKVCIYCWENKGAEFKDLVVTALDNYHETGDDSDEDIDDEIAADQEVASEAPVKIPVKPEEKKKIETDETGNLVERVEDDRFEEELLDYFTTEGNGGDDSEKDLSEIAGSYTEPENISRPDNFPNDWRIVDDGMFSRPSSWSLSNGVVTQTSNIYGGSDLAVSPVKPGTHLINGELDWEDYVFSGQMRSLDDDAIGIIFRYIDNNNYYRFSIDKQRKYRRLIKKFDGYVTTLAEDSWEYSEKKWYSFKIAVSGDHIRIFLDNKKVFDIRDKDIPKGKIGRYCWGNEGAEFKKFKVSPFRKKENTQDTRQIAQADSFANKDIKEKNDCGKLMKLENQIELLRKEIQKIQEECDCQ